MHLVLHFPRAAVATAVTGGAAHACGVVHLLTLLLIAHLSLLLQDFKSEAIAGNTLPLYPLLCLVSPHCILPRTDR